MGKSKAIVLRAAGINCDNETCHALELAGAEANRVHINQLIDQPTLLDDTQILVFPGGFSYGDDVAAGTILANQVVHHLYDTIQAFLEKGKLVLGICNGFQVLVKTGILPGFEARQSHLTITYNDSDKFEDRWVHLKPPSDHCVFLEQGRSLYLPIAHGEGKVVPRDNDVLTQLQSGHHIAFQYVDDQGELGPYPINPNGSVQGIAGLTDKTGRVLGLMPHPERYVHPTHHPHWTRSGGDKACDGMTLFNNAVTYVTSHL
ncbi:MAG: phosphoribosylformylglycinamidine synthase I [Phycisphaeraceae bacterium]|nr:phosphoribosylformylglycinamidine synthase I [Phycisphaeraceae bacterium]